MTPLPVHKPFPILELPPEIRKYIWRCAIVIDRDVMFRNCMTYHKSEDGLRYGKPAKICPNDSDPRQTSLLAVAFTCRQIYLEVTPIYYGENTFCWDSDYMHVKWREFKKFADAIGPTNASSIMDVNLDKVFGFGMDHCLILMPNVKRFHLLKHGLDHETKQVTFVAKTHSSVTIVFGGEVWGPDKW